MSQLADRRRQLRSNSTTKPSGLLEDANAQQVRTPKTPHKEVPGGSAQRRDPKNATNAVAKVPCGTPRRRPPKSAAVTITSVDPEKVSYAGILKQARERIELRSLGIEDSKIRRGINGGLIIEIPGENGASKADALSKKLREVLHNNTVRINRPTTTGEIRLWNFDDLISKSDILDKISVIGDCDEADIKIGNIRPLRNGLNSVWIKCPVTVALKISDLERIKIEWTVARTELLKKRPVQCFKCWRYVHVK
ncbi:uncharacterized protein LOC112462386, partial [Temnothorax curvispinosus]|uniref:Uncharacterized protein LOC112462386 n=1 Tax=Temnothorax curvispinosus TaxID=300111 RepID=A0A6J1QPM0_9HYME